MTSSIDTHVSRSRWQPTWRSRDWHLPWRTASLACTCSWTRTCKGPINAKVSFPNAKEFESQQQIFHSYPHYRCLFHKASWQWKLETCCIPKYKWVNIDGVCKTLISVNTNWKLWYIWLDTSQCKEWFHWFILNTYQHRSYAIYHF